MPEPPSTWYIQISYAVFCLTKKKTKIYFPSGAHEGETKSLPGSSETGFRNKNIFPIRRPRRRNKIAPRIFRNLLRVATVRFHDPDVVAAFAIREKRDPLSIGRKSRLAVKRHSAGDQLRLSAFNRERVNIAKQFEDDRLAVGRDVERKPRSFIGGELNLAVALQRQRRLFLVLFVLVVFLFFLFLFLLFLGSKQARRPKQAQRKSQRHHPHAESPPSELGRVHSSLLQFADQNSEAPLAIGNPSPGPTPF